MSQQTINDRKKSRFSRLPRMAQRLVKDRAAADQFLAAAPLTRMMIAAGVSPTPGLGIREFDAMLAIVNDALDFAPLSDEEFEQALRLSTPPECRETAQ